MRTLWMILSCLPLWLLAYPQGVEFGWSRSECSPGDVIELRASGAFSELSSYELRLPQHEALHLVAHQRQPVLYKNGVYTQEDVWVLQPLYSGTIELKEIQVRIHQAGEVSEELRAVPPLTVLPYSEQTDGNDAERLPDVVLEQGAASPWWLLLLLALLPLALFCIRRSRAVKDDLTEEAPVTLATVLAELEQGSIPHERIEYLLAAEGDRLASETRVALERVTYGQQSDAAELAKLLREEVKS